MRNIKAPTGRLVHTQVYFVSTDTCFELNSSSVHWLKRLYPALKYPFVRCHEEVAPHTNVVNSTHYYKELEDHSLFNEGILLYWKQNCYKHLETMT